MARTYTFNEMAGLNQMLRSVSKVASVELRGASAEIAQDVADKAATEAYLEGGAAIHVAPTIKARPDRVPRIVMGGTKRLPARDGRPRRGPNQTVGNVVWGAEFGSDRFPQFRPWRGNDDGAGYFLWPTVRDDSDEIMERYDDAVMAAVDRVSRRHDG
jgi:hypothetical protein